jgi:hypothetical protein
MVYGNNHRAGRTPLSVTMSHMNATRLFGKTKPASPIANYASLVAPTTSVADAVAGKIRVDARR